MLKYALPIVFAVRPSMVYGLIRSRLSDIVPLNTLLGIVFVSALLVIVVNFAVDLLYARLDPRISAEG